MRGTVTAIRIGHLDERAVVAQALDRRVGHATTSSPASTMTTVGGCSTRDSSSKPAEVEAPQRYPTAQLDEGGGA